jgi:hypothetical protein
LFGGSGFGPQMGITATPALTATEPVAEQIQPVDERPVSPQQAYMLRDYGAAIRGYLARIENGDATGSNYQQLGLAYERVGDRKNSLVSFKAAVKAYQAQVQAGTDSDVATRGLRSTQRALMMLEAQ